MLVKNWMTKSVITIDASDSIEKAITALRDYSHRMLPVIDKDKLVGVITDRDIKAASGLNCTEKGHLGTNFIEQKVKNIMIANPIHIFPEFTVEEAAETLLVRQISGMPVINNENKVIGIITQSDLFRLWVLFTGVAKKGVQMGFNALDKPGEIRHITDIIRDYGGRMESILCTHQRAQRGFRRIYVRFYNIDNVCLERLIEVLREKFDVLYFVDYINKRREIFESADTAV